MLLEAWLLVMSVFLCFSLLLFLFIEAHHYSPAIPTELV